MLCMQKNRMRQTDILFASTEWNGNDDCQVNRQRDPNILLWSGYIGLNGAIVICMRESRRSKIQDPSTYDFFSLYILTEKLQLVQDLNPEF